MSCALALAASLALADLYGAGPAAAPVQAENPLAREPLYADIVARARALKSGMEAAKARGEAPARGFGAAVADLAALDLKAHQDLKARGTDGDLSCILRGISEDLTRRMADIDAVTEPSERRRRMDELVYLLDDNVAVIVSPPRPPV